MAICEEGSEGEGQIERGNPTGIGTMGVKARLDIWSMSRLSGLVVFPMGTTADLFKITVIPAISPRACMSDTLTKTRLSLRVVRDGGDIL